MANLKTYINSKGRRCPWCSSDHLSRSRPVQETEEGDLVRQVTCLACQKQWVDLYQLVTVLPVQSSLPVVSRSGEGANIDSYTKEVILDDDPIKKMADKSR